MKQEEMSEFIKNSFKSINEYFHKAITTFEAEDIFKFRSEVKRLKFFLHLVSMESEDGLSFHITRRMKIIYGYLGIIQNFHLQLKEASEYVKKSSKPMPVAYINMLEKELENWKKLSKDYIDPDYNFLNDEYEILNTLPDKFTNKSTISFINYLHFEIREMSGHQDEEALNDIRKFMEDIYYNLPFLKPYLINPQSILLDEKELSEFLCLFGNFQDKCTAAAILQTIKVDALDGQEKQLIKQMADDLLHEKKEINKQLAVKLDSMHIAERNLNELSLQE
ncbi:MAG: hypothetical protein ABI325_04000 [Ginsengibacter sp.]